MKEIDVPQRCRHVKEQRDDMAHVTDESILTRSSFVRRLKNVGDDSSWEQFHERYGRLIYGFARKRGLNDPEAKDVAQETLLTLLKVMPKFVYDPARCTFKGWLEEITKRRVADHLRHLPRESRRPGASNAADTATDPIAHIADPNSFQPDALWEKEWQQNVVELAFERFKRQVKPERYQMFYLYVYQQQPAREVARALNKSLVSIYLAKRQLLPKFKKIVATLKGELGEG